MVRQLLIQDYIDKKELYRRLSENVANIMRSILRDLEINAIVSYREKSVHKFKEKLERKGYSDIEECPDLAGVRIVFYVQSDLELVHKLLQESFAIHEEESGKKQGKTGYQAFHYVASLKENRLSLQEYSDLGGLKCEIQLTTILSHAWSEIEHDIIYKPDSEVLRSFPKEIEGIEKKFTKVMKTHIAKAENEFEVLKQKYKSLEEKT